MKIGNVYNVASIKNLSNQVEGIKKGSFKDAAAAGIILPQQMTAIDPTQYMQKYPELTFAMSKMTVDNTGGWATVVQSLRTKPQGDFVDASDRDDTGGIISLSAAQDTIRVYRKKASMQWTDTEVKEAELAGRNLLAELMQATNRAYLNKLDYIGYLGNNENKGIFNNPYFTVSAADKPYADMTGQELYDMVAFFINAQWDGVSNTPEYIGTECVMPIGLLNKLRTTLLNQVLSAESVLNVLKKNFPDVVFTQTFRVLDKMALYSVSGDAMKFRIPLPLEYGEMVKLGSWDYKIDTRFSIAGLDVFQGDAGAILTGLV